MATDTLENKSAAATPSRKEWDAALAAMREADAKANKALVESARIEAAYLAEAEKVPHFIGKDDPYSGITAKLTTSNPEHIRHARRSIRDVIHYEDLPGIPEHMEACRELVEAAEAREQQLRAIDQKLGRTAASERYDAAVDRLCEAKDRLIAMPAPDGDALFWKLDYLFFSENYWQKDFVGQTVEDARRLLLVR